MRDSMIIYRSFFDAIKSLPSEDQAIVWMAIMEYGLNFQESDLSGINSTIFSLIKPQLDANLRRYSNGMKPKLNRKQKESKPEANDNDNDNDNKNENKIPKNQFVAPSQEEVILFFRANGFRDDIAIQCYKYYEDGSWKDSSGKKIISWKQKMRGVWFKPEHKVSSSTQSSSGYSRGSNYNPAR